MMCTLAVASLLTHLGVSAYGRLSDSLHHAAVARELAQALRDARNQAALQQRAVRLLPLEGDWGKGWRMSLEHNGQVLRERRLERTLRIVASSPREIRFSRRGAPLGVGFIGVSLALCPRAGGTGSHQVVLSPSGRVSLRSENSPHCAG
jgi:type IV fimbrial biogenesis protein FimT